jgi:hypothetical protein
MNFHNQQTRHGSQQHKAHQSKLRDYLAMTTGDYITSRHVQQLQNVMIMNVTPEKPRKTM